MKNGSTYKIGSADTGAELISDLPSAELRGFGMQDGTGFVYGTGNKVI